MWQLIFEIFCILSGAFVIVMFFMHDGRKKWRKGKLKSVRHENQFKKIDHAVTVYIAISKQPIYIRGYLLNQFHVRKNGGTSVLVVPFNRGTARGGSLYRDLLSLSLATQLIPRCSLG